MKYALCYWLLSFFFLYGCQKEIENIPPHSQDSDLSSLFSSEDAVDGVIRVKLDRKTADALAQAMTKSGNFTPTVSLKAICEQYHIVSMERIFPKNEMEERTRKAGLDLWYNVYFSEKEHTKTDIAEEFSRTPGVTDVEPVRKIKRIGRRRLIGLPDSLSFTPTPHRSAVSALPFNDPYLQEQWNYDNDGSIHTSAQAGADIHVVPCWEETAGLPEVIVAIVDEGVQYNHPDLQANMWSEIGYNFCDNTTDITWGEGHGTHVAGIIAAVNNNHIGISGIAGGKGNGDGVKIMTCEIFNDKGEAANNNGCAQAIKYGADHGAVISQNSWGYEAGDFSTETTWARSDKVVKEAIDYFIANAGMSADGQTQTGPMAGGVVIFAAGNETKTSPAFPAAYSPCINVAAISCNYEAAWYTNYGSTIDICAPGGGAWVSIPYDIRYTQGYILSTLPTTLENGNIFYDSEGKPYEVDYVKTPGYGYMQGTSMACPHVSGIAALLVSKFGGPGFTNDQLKDILFNSARNIDSYQPYNYKSNIGPLLDAGKAFTYSSENVPAPEIIPAEGQSNHLYLLDYETAHLKFTLKNYTGYTLTGEAGQITHSQSGDQIDLSINTSAIAPGNYTATLIARNLSYSSNYTIHYTVEQNYAPENICPIPTLCFSGSGITQTLDLKNYFTDPNEDINRYSIQVVPGGLFQTNLTNNILQITSTDNGMATVQITATDKGKLSTSVEFKASTDNKTFQADFYPNPCKNILHVKPGKIDGISMETGNVLLLTPTGREVFRQNVRFTENQASDLDLSSLSSGKYLLTLSCRVNNREMISTQTILKQ